MNTANDFRLLVDDLAGHWTEGVLENLRAAGVHHISVEMELEAWRTLKNVLDFELRWQRVFRRSTLAHLSTVMDQVIHEATAPAANANRQFSHSATKSLPTG